MRLDALLSANVEGCSRASLQKAIKSGHCLRNARPEPDPAVKVKAGDSIAISLPEAVASLEPSEEALTILWDDRDLAVCVKPAGLSVHPCPSCQEMTLANRLVALYPELLAQGGERPGIVHRLDKDTSGLMLVALSEKARLQMAEAFAQRQVGKEYLALVSGVPPEKGECRLAIGRHPTLKTRMAAVPEDRGGRPARTEWRRLCQEPHGKFSLLALRIYTGRTHQIRVHMAQLGYPILGDKLYAPKKIAAMAPRQMLHAWKLAFSHPRTGREMSFMEPPPADFIDAAIRNSAALLRIIVTGNQGCGKSSFCADLASLGLPEISADAIVRDLYGRKSAATEWISDHYGPDTLNPDHSVNKAALFAAMQAKPGLRADFENAIHGLVRERIEQFWQEHADKAAAVAEIPLYFESGYQKQKGPDDFIIGISCPQDIRWQRIRANRGWSDEKIATLESWQWPEAQKMASCDMVIANDGDAESLREKAARLSGHIDSLLAARQDGLRQSLYSLCGIEAGGKME